MSAGVLAAGVASVPPTLAALLAFVNARAARRQADTQARAGLAAKIDSLGGVAARTEAGLGQLTVAVGRLGEGQAQLGQRVARLEGAVSRPVPRP